MSFSDKYLSFKTSRMNPLAESTAIGSPMGLNHSPDSFRGNQKRKPISPLTQEKQRQMKLQIEPHILTNAQSPGIVKRLCSYYNESQGETDKNRYVYNRVGDFPLVQLKRNEIKRNLIRSPTTRIAPPNRTVMNRDVRAAILRSNSFQLGSNVPKLMPTKMRAKDDLHQIITNHDPLPTIDSAQSAKSVLDALEKNCRKRINNEELTLDRNKRVCATAQQEVVDAPSTREFMPITPQTSKRGREQISPTKSGGDSPNAQQTKKFRIRNNALLSSLSSSHYVLKPYTAASSPSLPKSSPKSSITTLKEISKALSYTEKEDKEKEAEKLVEKKASESPPKPSAEKRLYLFNRKVDPSSYSLRVQDDDDDDEIKINFVKPRESAPAHDNDIIRQADKDKLSMMLSGLSDGFKSPTKETPKDSVDSVPASISFKTVTTSSTGPITTPALTTSPLALNVGTNSTSSSAGKAEENKEKLALPVVCAPSVTVAPETSESEAPKTLLNFQFGASSSEKPAVTTSSALPSLSVASSTASSTSESSAETVIPSGKLSPLFGSSSSNKTTETSPASNLSQPLISFTPIAKSVNFTSAPSLFPSISTTTSLAPTLPAMTAPGGFNFGAKETPKTTSSFAFGSNLGTTNSTSSNNLSTIPPNPVVSASPLSTTSTPAFNIAKSATPAFSFGSISATSTNILNKATTGSGSLQSNSISFGQKPETTTASGIGFSFSNSQTAVVSPTVAVTTASGGFSFGGSQSSLNTTQTAPPAATNSFFGSSATPSVFGQPASTGSTAASSSVFGQPAVQPTPAAVPVFGQPAAQTPAFSGFGAKTEATPAQGMFAFGQKPTATVAATTTSSFSFGGSAPAVTTASSAFSFGQTNAMQSAAAAPAQSGIFSRLGDKPAEAKPAFSFGGQQPSNVTSPFGSSGSNNNSQTAVSPPMFGSSNSSFTQAPASDNVFGSSTQSNGFGAPSAAKPPSTGMFSFNANANQTQSQPPAPASMFNFGGSSTPAQSSPASNLFGSNPGHNVSASFSFKASNGVVAPSSTSPNFGQNQSSSAAPPPAYQFGQQVGNTVSASYTFGGSSANTSSQSVPSNGFNFSGPQTAPVTGGFNFQGQQPVLTPQPSPGGGLFNIGTGGNNQQQRRPIRQATRRMK